MIHKNINNRIQELKAEIEKEHNRFRLGHKYWLESQYAEIMMKSYINRIHKLEDELEKLIYEKNI